MSNDWLAIGINQATAAIELREALAASGGDAQALNSDARAATGQNGIVVLSTCSRFEVYCRPDKDGEQAVALWLSRRAGRALDSALYAHRGQDAVRHLFRVAAGLDSWVLGETEILGQCKAAYQAACREKTVDRYGHLAFQRALMVGKKIRSQTRIVGGISSIGGAAAVMAQKIFENLKERTIVVFGAGAMAAASVRHLRYKGAARLMISNRSLGKAQTLAAELGGEPLSFAEGFERLAQADIAIFSTASDQCLLDQEAAMRSLANAEVGLYLLSIWQCPETSRPTCLPSMGCICMTLTICATPCTAVCPYALKSWRTPIASLNRKAPIAGLD